MSICGTTIWAFFKQQSSIDVGFRPLKPSQLSKKSQTYHQVFYTFLAGPCIHHGIVYIERDRLLHNYCMQGTQVRCRLTQWHTAAVFPHPIEYMMLDRSHNIVYNACIYPVHIQNEGIVWVACVHVKISRRMIDALDGPPDL
jgi:hypothetical protein